MKKKIFYFLPLLVAGALVSCNKEKISYVDPEFDPNVIETTFIVQDFSLNSELMKSSISDKGATTWEAGDEVYYFTDAAAKQMSKVAITAGGKTASVLLDHKSGSKYVAAYYPGEKVSSVGVTDYTLKTFTCPGINPSQSGKAVQPAVAYNTIGDDTRFMNLTLTNICSALQFSLPEGNDIDKVVMTVNEQVAGNEINGAFKVDLTAASPAAAYSSVYSGAAAGSQYETIVATGKKGGTFYINVLPCTLAKGFTLNLYSGNSVKLSVNYADKAAAFIPGRIYSIGDPSAVPPEPEKFTFTTDELGSASGWPVMVQDPTKAEGSPIELFTDKAQYGDLTMSVPENPSGSQNGYVTSTYDTETKTFSYKAWRFYQARNKGTLVISSMSGRNIKSVKFTYTNKNTGVIMCGDVQIDNNVEVTFSDVQSTRTFTCGNTGTSSSGQYSIESWEITVQ